MIDVEDQPNVLVGHHRRLAALRRRDCSARIVDQDVDPSEAFLRLPHGVVHCLAIRQIGLHLDRLTAERLHLLGNGGGGQRLAELARAGQVHVEDGDVGAKPREPQSVGPPQPARRTCHDRNPAL